MSENLLLSTSEPTRVPFRFHEYYWPLDEADYRYYVYHGGRGGGKSWAVARWILLEGTQRDLRVLCARELQNSIKESVYQLLVDQINMLGLQSKYQIKESEIVGITCPGTRITFAGLRALKGDPNKLKSYEGLDVLWIEEAALVLQSSFDTIDPTMRKAGAKIIMTLNPILETDFIYAFFIKKTPPKGTYCQAVSWRDNEWFPKKPSAPGKPPNLYDVMMHRKMTDPDGYQHIWEGKCRLTLEGAVYADEIRAAMSKNRVTRVPYEPTKPVHTFWDLGFADKTAIWFAQKVGFEYRIIDFYQNRQKGPLHYIQMLQNRGYVYGTDYLPHDADYQQFSAGGRTVADLMRAAGRKVHVIKRPTKKSQTHDAVRTIFPNCWFDEEKCSDGLQCLRHYRYDVDPDTNQYSKTPLHDENSHAADAFGTLALFCTEEEVDMKVNLEPELDLRIGGGLGWMGR